MGAGDCDMPSSLHPAREVSIERPAWRRTTLIGGSEAPGGGAFHRYIYNMSKSAPSPSMEAAMKPSRVSTVVFCFVLAFPSTSYASPSDVRLSNSVSGRIVAHMVRMPAQVTLDG